MGLQYKEVNERLFLNYRKVNGVSWLILSSEKVNQASTL